ncbi:NAD(P)H-binding protein [Streptomyces sp. H10-C2]|uniref:SDR family oxidoreductase n=1 Tax=unclassified Streptomyces TaxID=2593676 RepID=UPI0024B8A0E8|nr:MULTISPECIES: NAD(P)H-binding protein [unclassified Streptomyces]MDJ0346118.1 NAD(P)H-binding protein [Streptomyces sp. PH10-H1]MDJ0371620.1 NAD(P)H-binding protein [Streptomyces sp. H10-C2]
MRVAVAGGTGLIGRYVVEELTAAGHETVVLARSRGVDLVSGTGLDAAMADVKAVIDVSNMTTMSGKKAVSFFGTASRNLLDAGARAGVRHHVALSIVGIDRVGYGYYQGKLRQEEMVEGGPVPWTVLRATQFHEFAQQMLDRSPKPLAMVPRMRTQPIAAREVARHLVGLALAPPQGMAPELAGPQVEQLVDMVHRLLRARHQRRLVLPVKLPGATGAAMTGDGQLPTGSGPRGTQTFEAWLSQSAALGG